MEQKEPIVDPIASREHMSESYFIQLVDIISFVVNLYAKNNLCTPTITWGKRIRNVLSNGEEIALMDILNPVLNIHASKSNPYGIVYYPK